MKVPKDTFPGGTFKVSVPVKQKTEEEDLGEKDHNKFSRDFQEAVDDYARAYDEWCRKQHAVDKKFALLKEKQAKFDPIVAIFPKDLMTPVTVEYMKKIIRRARQNKHKRLKMQASKQDSPKDDEGEPKSEAKKKKADTAEKKNEPKKKKAPAKTATKKKVATTTTPEKPPEKEKEPDSAEKEPAQETSLGEDVSI